MVVGLGRGVGIRLLAVTLAVATVAALVPATPAEAVTPRRHGAERVLGGITTERLEIRAGGSTARGNLLRFREDDPDIDLRPRLARNTIAGTEGMVAMSRRELSRGAVAGINGGYWLSRPWGTPNGLFVDRGQLLAGQAERNSTGGGPTGRGMVGWRQHGRPVMDLLEVTLTLEQPAHGTPPVRIDEVNRQSLSSIGVTRPGGELLLFTDRFGTGVNVPADSVLITLEGLRLGSSGTASGTVVGTRAVDRATTVPLGQGQQLLVAYDDRRGDLTVPLPGEELRVTTSLAPASTPASAWEDLWGGVAGGQLLVRDGRRRSVDEWRGAAAFSDAHATARQPRTVIARHRDGEVWLITIDGRRAGWSAGITLRDLADALVELGVTDAVNLDGGGSTMMTVGGAIRNRPSESGRSVADGLFLYVPEPAAARSLDSACTPQVQEVGVGFLDVPGTTHASAITCLAGWGVTSGVTATRFDPNARVSREQMASFLARWIDDHATRGSGQPLPEAGSAGFDDVTDTNVHASAIRRLAAAGIVSGRGAGRFEPQAPVTRAQTATMVSQAIEQVWGSSLPDGRDTFIDDNGSPHEANIDRLAGSGIVRGIGGFDFGPQTPVNRGAMASILMLATALLVEEGVAVLPGDEVVVATSEEEPDTVEEDEAPTEDAGQGDGGEGDDGAGTDDGTGAGDGPDGAAEDGDGLDGDAGDAGGSGDGAEPQDPVGQGAEEGRGTVGDPGGPVDEEPDVGDAEDPGDDRRDGDG